MERERERETWIHASLLSNNESRVAKFNFNTLRISRANQPTGRWRIVTSLCCITFVIHFGSSLRQIVYQNQIFNAIKILTRSVGCACVTSGNNGGIGRLEFNLGMGLWLCSVNNFRVGSVNYESVWKTILKKQTYELSHTSLNSLKMENFAVVVLIQVQVNKVRTTLNVNNKRTN
jgi:hypothetical protein